MPKASAKGLSNVWSLVCRTAIALFPALSADRQTTGTWAAVIESYAEIPDPYRPFFEPLRQEGRKLPYLVRTPSDEGFTRAVTEKLICERNGEIQILERRKGGYSVRRYPLTGVSCVETGACLLASWIAISGLSDRGDPISSTLRFNTVTDHLLAPFLSRIRGAASGPPGAVPDSEWDPSIQPENWTIKFRNYARRSLLDGERVVAAVMQPAIRRGTRTPLGEIFQRSLFPAHLLMLTDGELILIRENSGRRVNITSGGVWHFIPLKKNRRRIAGRERRRPAGSIHPSAGKRPPAFDISGIREEYNRPISLPDEGIESGGEGLWRTREKAGRMRSRRRRRIRFAGCRPIGEGVGYERIALDCADHPVPEIRFDCVHARPAHRPAENAPGDSKDWDGGPAIAGFHRPLHVVGGPGAGPSRRVRRRDLADALVCRVPCPDDADFYWTPFQMP
jgi:hypothetical protein